jgi:hypothetical protein
MRLIRSWLMLTGVVTGMLAVAEAAAAHRPAMNTAGKATCP